MPINNEILISISKELDSAKAKHPHWPEDIIHAAAIVAEESGELIRAALQFKYENKNLFETEKEAIQTAAMAIRFLEGLNKLKQ